MQFLYRLAHIKHFALILLFVASLAFSQQSASTARILSPIDNAVRVTLTGNTHLLARAEFDRGAAPDSMSARRMLLLLSGGSEQQAALQQLLDEQQTPGSANFRRWLTPTEFGQQFGAADADVQTVTAWLQQQGFQLDRVASAKNVIEFSGSAGQVRQTFGTALHKYLVAGKEYWANASDPQIPQALTAVVKGLVSLNNFPRKPLSRHLGAFSHDASSGKVSPLLTGSGSSFYALAPADFATIYNTAPLLQAGNNGTGQVIALVGVSNINLQDITSFRTLFGLGAGNTSVVLDGPDPGIVSSDESESVLDVEWASAVAPGASVVLVSAQDTETTSGLDLAALHILENNMAGVMSESYGACEAELGTAGNQFMQTLWQQAAAQGITVTVSSGDNGSAGCDNMDTAYIAQYGMAVNGFASTPYNVAVGGTDFNDTSAFATYWNTTNSSTWGSAKSYIPEMTWNGTCAASATAGNLNTCPALPSSGTPPDSLNLWSGSGGASNCAVSTTISGGTIVCQSGTPKPSWQSGTGVPSDGVRDLPDISLFSAVNTASNSFYVVCEADLLPAGYNSCQLSGGSVYFSGFGGTSAAAPSFAGITALAEQKAGTRLGNLNYLLYSLAAKSGASCISSGSQGSGCVFHDVTVGNNSVPCVAGSPNCSQTSGSSTGVIVESSGVPAHTASNGYDLATGLGSVNAANLVTAIATAVGKFTPSATALTLNSGTSTITAKHGDPINVAVNVTPTSSTGSVSLSGSKGGIDMGTLSGGVADWTSKLFPGGSYSVKAHYAGDGARAASESNTVPVSISAENSLTFVNLVTFDASNNLQSFAASSVPYGSNYVLRMDVTDAAGTVSASQGVSSKCVSGTASCPTGTLTVTSNGVALDGGSFALNSAGHAEDQKIQLTPGSYAIAATYPGDSSYNTSSGSAAVTISKAPTTVSFSPAGTSVGYGVIDEIVGSAATTSSGVAPIGSFTFLDNGTQVTVSNPIFSSNPYSSSSYAACLEDAAYAFTSVGTHSLVAQYSGDANYAAGTSAPNTFTVAQGPTYFNDYGVTPNPTALSLPVTATLGVFTYSYAAAPSGQVTFYDNGTLMTGSVTYLGLPGSWGKAGYVNTTAELGATLPPYTFTQTGTHVITATYSGDANYKPFTQQIASVNVSSKLASETSNLASSLNPALVNFPTTLSVAVGPTTYGVPVPTGTVTFLDGGTALSGTVAYLANSGQLFAKLSVSLSTTGVHNITASYSGDPNFASSTTATSLALTVDNKLPTSVAYFNGTPAVASQPTNLTTIVGPSTVGTSAPTMGGTVTFLDGGTELPGAVNITSYGLNGADLLASLSYTFTAPGSHSITVQYSGDANYAAVTSPAFPLTIAGPFALSLSSNSVTLGSAGGSGIVSVYVSNNTTSAASVALTCTPSSTAASCTLGSSQVSVGASGRNSVNMTFTVPALTGAVQHRRIPWGGGNGLVLAGVFAGAWVARRKRRSLILALLGAVLLLSLLSCGGSGGSSTPVLTPQSYTFTITGTSGANTSTQVLTVTVGS